MSWSRTADDLAAGGHLAAEVGVAQLVAGRLGHKGAGYLITNDPPGAEYTINLAAICAVFALLGPGSFSLDQMIFG